MREQCVAMWKYLKKHGKITGLESLTNLGIISYTKVISDLRNEGVLIASIYVKRRSRFGVKRFVEYHLVKNPNKVKPNL